MLKQGRKGASRDPVVQNTIQLAETIRKTEQKNAKKYSSIRKSNPDYELKLYKPFIPTNFNRDQIKLAEQILLRQMDKLMEEQALLDIQLDRLAVKQQQYHRKRQKEAISNMDHFTFLRRQWANDEQVSNSKQHVEKLIHNVGSIKGHIHTIIKKQSKNNSNCEFHDLILQSPEYLTLQRRIQQLEGKNDFENSGISTQSSSRMTVLEQQVQTLKKQLQKTMKENEALKKGNSQDDQQKRAWIYKYRVKGGNGGYVMTIHTQTRVSGMPETTQLSLEDLRENLRFGEQKNEKKQQEGGNGMGRKFGIQQIFSPKFISRKRIEIGDRFRPMSP